MDAETLNIIDKAILAYLKNLEDTTSMYIDMTSKEINCKKSREYICAERAYSDYKKFREGCSR